MYEAAIDCAVDENKTIITKEIMAKGIEEILRSRSLCDRRLKRWTTIR